MEAPHQQYGMVMALVMLVLLMNVAAIVLRSRLARKLRGH
jgi:phosphate transport system permease protein